MVHFSFASFTFQVTKNSTKQPRVASEALFQDLLGNLEAGKSAGRTNRLQSALGAAALSHHAVFELNRRSWLPELA